MDYSAQTLYLNEALRQIPRLVSREDREPFSKTYGCFDRTYWSWKFTDFPGARFQEGLYALAFLFVHASVDHPFAGSKKVLDWAKAGFSFWQSIQYSDGSFDEAYPEEHSLAATAFTGFYVGEAYRLLEPHLEEKEQVELKNTFARVGGWLCQNDERHGLLTNHLAAAAAALQTIYRITRGNQYLERSHYFLNRIYEHQSLEGWYEEYGGADPGYQTHATFYLAKIWEDSKDETLLKSLDKSIQFLKHCVHPNGTLGGEYGSRNTEFYFPAGFEILAKTLPDARLIAGFMRPSIVNQAAVGLHAVDAYNFCPLLNNYLFAHESLASNDLLGSSVRSREGLQSNLPFQNEGEWFFKDAGLFFKSGSGHYSVVGLSKGGVLKVYDQKTKKLIASDCGYWASTEDGKIVSSQAFKRSPLVTNENGELIIKTTFAQVSRNVFHPWLFILFRLYSLTLGRFRTFSYFVKKLLVQVLVQRRKEVPVVLTRKICFGHEQIVVLDEIQTGGEIKFSRLQRGIRFATIHMGSARYFQPQELDGLKDDGENLLEVCAKLEPLRFEQTIRLLTHGVHKAF